MIVIIPIVSVLYRDSRYRIPSGIESITRIRCSGQTTHDLKYCSFTQGDSYSCSTCFGSLGLKCYCKFCSLYKYRSWVLYFAICTNRAKFNVCGINFAVISMSC